MTKRHFEALARALNDSRPRDIVSALDRQADELIAKHEQWRSDVRAIATVLSPRRLGKILLAHNPRFDARFYEACGYELNETTEEIKS